jgi:hypothetical protein
MKNKYMKPEIKLFSNAYDDAIGYLKEELRAANYNLYAFFIKPLEDELIENKHKVYGVKGINITAEIDKELATEIEYLVKNEEAFKLGLESAIDKLEQEQANLYEDASSYIND